MTSITARNAAALTERNGSTLPQTKATPKTKATKEAPAKEATVAETPEKAPKATPTPVACHCGCGETANIGRTYRPGHDARHAGQVARRVVANVPGADAELAALPPKLQEKAARFVSNRGAETERKAKAAEIRKAAAAELKAKLAAL
jgi:hypothetical protein